MTTYEQIVTEKGVDQEKLYRLIRYGLINILYKRIYKNFDTGRYLTFLDTLHSYYLSLAGPDGSFGSFRHLRCKFALSTYLINGYYLYLVTQYKKDRKSYLYHLRFCKKYILDNEPDFLSENEIERFATAFSVMAQKLDPWKEELLVNSLIEKYSERKEKATSLGINQTTYRVNIFRVKQKFKELCKSQTPIQMDLDDYYTGFREKIICDFNNLDQILSDHLNHIKHHGH